MGFTLYTMPEAAKEARLCRRSLERQISAGRGPAVTRLGGKMLVRSDELIAWIDRNTRRPAQAA